MRLFNSAREYHEKTKYSFEKVKSFYKEFARSPIPENKKDYPSHPRYALPQMDRIESLSLEAALQTAQKFSEFQELEKESVSPELLSGFLHLVYGITQKRKSIHREVAFRAAPSASGLYPAELYVVIQNVTGFSPGIYYYHPLNHELVLLSRENSVTALQEAGFGIRALENAAFYLIVTSVFDRNSWKFGERAYRYCLMDVGFIAGNVTSAAAGLGLTCNIVGDFADEALNRLLHIDGVGEATLLLFALGKGAEKATTEHYTFEMITPEEDVLSSRFSSLLQGIHQNSSHFAPGVGKLAVSVQLPWKPEVHKKTLRNSLITLPAPQSISHLSVAEAIQKRRSAHSFVWLPLTQTELSTLLFFLKLVPPLYNMPAYYIYVVINDVEGLENGLYLYHLDGHGLEQLRSGTFRGDISYLTIVQDAVFNSAVAFFFTTDFEDISLFSNRGYRYAHLNTGMLGESIYLTGTALGLGARGIGNFFDDSLNEFLGVREPHEKVLGGMIVGKV